VAECAQRFTGAGWWIATTALGWGIGFPAERLLAHLANLIDLVSHWCSERQLAYVPALPNGWC
jgi:hypothetical protein